ncbi:tetratricopeptide repeat protein [Exiguobacterium artemiae]
MTHTLHAHSNDITIPFAELDLLNHLTSEIEVEQLHEKIQYLQKLAPTHPLPSIAHAYGLFHAKDFSAARQQIELARDKTGDHVRAHLLLGLMSEVEQFQHEAEQHFLTALKLFPGEPIVHRYLAVHYYDRTFHGEAAHHALQYLKKIGPDREGTLMMIDMMQSMPDHDDYVLESLYALLLEIPEHRHDMVFHAIAANNAEMQYDAFCKTLDGEPDEATTARLDSLLSLMVEHSMWAAIHDQSDERMYRKIFTDMCRDLTFRHAGLRSVPLYLSIRSRYWINRLLHRG